MAITGGVGEALVATASGLAVAIVALVGHSYYGYRLDNMMTGIEHIGDTIMELEQSGQRHLVCLTHNVISV